MLVKVPQITRILSNRSVAGLQARMFRSEVLSGTVAVAYLSQQRLALAAYAELFFLLAQNLIILFLIAYYAERPEGVTAWRGVAANVPHDRRLRRRRGLARLRSRVGLAPRGCL